LNIKSQLAGIQAIADIVNGGNAGGVIFTVYRSQQNVTWNKPDGGAMRVDKWFFNIQADPEWVKKAFARMSSNALTGEVLAKALLPGDNIEGPVNPETEEEFTPSEDAIEGEFTEPEEPPAKVEKPLKFNDAIIIAIFAKEWNISIQESAKELFDQRKAGKIPETLTESAAHKLAQMA
jgi:hypothetical protein